MGSVFSSGEIFWLTSTRAEIAKSTFSAARDHVGQCRNVSALRSHLKRLKIRKRIPNVSEGSKTPASTWTDAVSDRKIFRQPYKGDQKIFRRAGQEKGGMVFLTRSRDEKTLPKSLYLYKCTHPNVFTHLRKCKCTHAEFTHALI